MRSTNWFRGVTLALATLAAPPLRAQSPEERAALTAWEDTVRMAQGVDQVAALERLAGGVRDATKNVRRSMAQARLAVLKGDQRSISLAVDNLNWDVVRHGDWVWPRYLLARLFMELEMQGRAPRQPTKLGFEEPSLLGGWRYLREALRRDPGFLPAHRLVIDMALPSGDREFQDEMIPVLRAIVETPFPDPDALLVWGRYLRTLRRYDSAQRVFTRAALAGGDLSRLALERARTFLALGDSASATIAYWDGVERLTPAGRELYRYDLSWLVADDSLAVFDRIAPDRVEPWLRAFWNQRDAAAANEPGDRLLEHLRRWVVVNAQFRSFVPWRRTMFKRVELGFDADGGACMRRESKLYDLLGKQPSLKNDLRFRETLYDQRGLLYLRHGEPVARIGGRRFDFDQLDEPTSSILERAAREQRNIRQSGNESWVYWIQGDWRIINFTGSQYLGTYAATTLKSFLPYSADAYQSVGAYSRVYAEAGAAIRRFVERRNMERATAGDAPPLEPACAEPAIRLAVEQSQADARIAVATDSDSPPITDPWASVVRAYALGSGRDGNGRVLLTWAIAAKDLEAVDEDLGRVDYPVAVRAVLYRAETDETIRIDSVMHFRSGRRFGQSGWVNGRLEVPVGPGNWQVAFFARQGTPGAGTYALQRLLAIDSAATLTMSDIIPGREDAATWLAPDGLAFPVNPMTVWARGSSALLYYELRGLAQGEAFRTTVNIFRGLNQKPDLTLDLPGTATGRVEYMRKTVGLQQLEPGAYRMVVRVQAGTRAVERTMALVIDQ